MKECNLLRYCLVSPKDSCLARMRYAVGRMAFSFQSTWTVKNWLHETQNNIYYLNWKLCRWRNISPVNFSRLFRETKLNHKSTNHLSVNGYIHKHRNFIVLFRQYFFLCSCVHASVQMYLHFNDQINSIVHGHRAYHSINILVWNTYQRLVYTFHDK